MYLQSESIYFTGGEQFFLRGISLKSVKWEFLMQIDYSLKKLLNVHRIEIEVWEAQIEGCFT